MVYTMKKMRSELNPVSDHSGSLGPEAWLTLLGMAAGLILPKLCANEVRYLDTRRES